MEHAKLSPSSAKRWLTCTMSPTECFGLEEGPTSPFAAEGTEAHEMLEQWLKRSPGLELLTPGKEEMQSAVKVAYDYIQELLAQDPGSVLLTESTVGPGALGPDVWGTADVILYQPAFKKLYVIDYKHGKGIAVDLPAPQLEVYAILAMDSFSWMFGEIVTVETMILQPRAFHSDGPIRGCEYTLSKLSMTKELMLDAIGTIGTDQAEYAPSEDACRWCLAKSQCSALENAALDAAQMTFAEIPKKGVAKKLGAEKLVTFHNNRKLIDLWLKALDEQILNDLMAGKEVGDLKVVQGLPGNRAWASDDETIAEALKQHLKLKPKEIVTEKLKSVKQIEDVLNEKPSRNMKKKLEAFQELITRKPGKPTVASGDDKRESIAPQFKDLTQGA